MDNYTISKEKLISLRLKAYNDGAEACLELLMQRINILQTLIEEDFEYSESNYGFKTEEAIGLNAQLIVINKVIKEIDSIKKAIEQTRKRNYIQ